MNKFSVLIIEDQLSATTKIVTAIGQHLVEYSLSVTRNIANALKHPESVNVVLWNVPSFTPEVEQQLVSLTQLYPDTPIVLVLSAEATRQEADLLKALKIAVKDYVTFSEAGLLILGRRLTDLKENWVNQQLLTTDSNTQALPPFPAKGGESDKFQPHFNDDTSSLAFQVTATDYQMLYRIIGTLSTPHDSPTIMKLVLQEYLKTLNLTQGRVIRFNLNKTKFNLVKINHGWPDISESLEKQPLDLQNDQIYDLIAHQQSPLIIEHMAAGWFVLGNISISIPPKTDFWLSENSRLALLIPLESRNGVAGAIVVELFEPSRVFSDREISLGGAVAHQLSMALSNVELYEAEYQRRQQSETLRDVAAVVSSSINLNEVLERVLDQLGRVIDYDSAAIHLIERNQRRVIAGRGFPNPKEIIGRTFAAKFDPNEPGSIVIHTRQPLLIGNVVQAYTSFHNPYDCLIKSWMGIPLIAHDQIIGLISIDHLQVNAYGQEEVDLTLAFANQVAIALENARLHELAVNRLEHELTIAQEIQQTLLPHVFPQIPGLEISGRILPARQVGGDFFHFFAVGGGNQLGVAIGDVSGKGIPAALYMAVAITAIDIQVRNDIMPGELMNRLNEALYDRLQENKMNIGLQVATFEPLVSPGASEEEPRGVLMTVASGGMIWPIGATERGCRLLPVSGLPIGALPSPDQVYEDDMFLLDPFTTIIFTSDGIVEAQNETGELFGFERLEATINEIISTRHAETVMNYIFEAAQKFIGKAEQHDDMTVVVVVKK